MTQCDENPIEKIRARLDGGNKWLKGGFAKGDKCCIATASYEIQPPDRLLATRAVLDEVISEQFPERSERVLEKGAQRWEESRAGL